jgi:hypothetical protein
MLSEAGYFIQRNKVNIIASVAKVGEGPFEGLVSSLTIAGDEIGVYAVPQMDFLPRILDAGQHDFVVVQVRVCQ